MSLSKPKKKTKGKRGGRQHPGGAPGDEPDDELASTAPVGGGRSAKAEAMLLSPTVGAKRGKRGAAGGKRAPMSDDSASSRSSSDSDAGSESGSETDHSDSESRSSSTSDSASDMPPAERRRAAKQKRAKRAAAAAHSPNAAAAAKSAAATAASGAERRAPKQSHPRARDRFGVGHLSSTHRKILSKLGVWLLVEKCRQKSTTSPSTPIPFVRFY